MSLTLKEKVLKIVQNIPDQKVMFFGQIAKLLNSNPRTVGWILSGLSIVECQNLPWYRVVAKDGYISSLKMGVKGEAQRQFLQLEGYLVVNDHVDMEIHLLKDFDINLLGEIN